MSTARPVLRPGSKYELEGHTHCGNMLCLPCVLYYVQVQNVNWRDTHFVAICYVYRACYYDQVQNDSQRSVILGSGLD